MHLSLLFCCFSGLLFYLFLCTLFILFLSLYVALSASILLVSFRYFYLSRLLSFLSQFLSASDFSLVSTILLFTLSVGSIVYYVPLLNNLPLFLLTFYLASLLTLYIATFFSSLLLHDASSVSKFLSFSLSLFWRLPASPVFIFPVCGRHEHIANSQRR